MLLFALGNISNMDRTSTKKDLVLSAINQIRKKTRKRPDKDRLTSHLWSKFDILEEDALKIIDGLESDGSIRLETYEDGSTSYFISSASPVSSHQGSSQSRSSFIQKNQQSDPTYSNLPIDGGPRPQGHVCEDLPDFKKYMHGELFELKALILNRSLLEYNKLPSKKFLDYERLLIRSLKDRIISLER